ncbi:MULTISPECIES: ABC transporter ATP-binding protein [Actinoplanes]|uniref:ATP-binding cassette domain-containing protein n=1 Tax=Actinoplanes TaxID=1865 RepID=UPI0005F2810C|nr:MULTISPECIES: ABC transporter ATP-binding protein [Actinoplanes]GLY02981.1 ABC transporter [Actinoplanes sp. NBRC 101535]
MTLTITVNDLQVRYGETVGLQDLSAELPGGKIYGLLGRNGSGKTSLLAVLAGFRKPSAGTVTVDGLPVFENSRITRQVCLIRESGIVGDPTDSVRDTLDVARRLRPGWDAGYATTLIELFGLPPRKRVSELSLGQRSAFGVAVGLASRAPVTMFDEAHLGMDAPTRQAFQDELLRDFIARPRTIIISTHLVEEHSPLFERVLILREGRLLVHEDLDDLRAQGMSLTGPAATVDGVVAGLTILNQQQLGPTKSVTVSGAPDEVRRAAEAAGLEIGPVAVQDLFIHLTQPTGATR